MNSARVLLFNEVELQIVDKGKLLSAYKVKPPLAGFDLCAAGMKNKKSSLLCRHPSTIAGSVLGLGSRPTAFTVQNVRDLIMNGFREALLLHSRTNGYRLYQSKRM